MLEITISPLYKKDILEITTYKKEINENTTISIIVSQLWRSGSFIIQIPQTKKEIKEWKQYNPSFKQKINTTTLIDHYIREQEFINLNELPFDYELDSTQDCCDVDYEYGENIPEDLQVNVGNIDDLEENGWYIDENDYQLTGPFDIIED